jgi:hypothetical protein
MPLIDHLIPFVYPMGVLTIHRLFCLPPHNQPTEILFLFLQVCKIVLHDLFPLLIGKILLPFFIDRLTVMSLDRLPLLSRRTITTFCFLSFHDHYRYVDVRFCILFYLRKHYYHILLIEEYTYI